MKSITFNVVKDGKGYVKTILAPSSSAEARRADRLGMIIAGTLLLMTVSVIALMLLAR